MKREPDLIERLSFLKGQVQATLATFLTEQSIFEGKYKSELEGEPEDCPELLVLCVAYTNAVNGFKHQIEQIEEAIKALD